MPIITQLKPQRNGKRVNVYVDNQFAFGIDLDNLVLSGIKIDKEFSSEELNEIIKKAEFQKSFDKLVNFVTFRPRSEKEVNMWFKRKEIPEVLHDELKQKIKKLGFLNDESFAKWWVEQRIIFKNKSPKIIKLELQQKGISRDLIDKVLSEQDVDEEQLAKKLLDKKSRRWERFDDQTRVKKQTEFLIRNGFSWDLVKKLTKLDYVE